MSVELEYSRLIRLIKERLITLKITQSELARKVGISPPAISQIINKIKYPTVLTLLNILQALELIVSYEIRENP